MPSREPFVENRLFTPGPTPVPLNVRLASMDRTIYHRDDPFYELFLRCARRLQPIFGSSDLPIILASSGSGAMEAAVLNLTEPGDEVVVVHAGKFSERWVELNKAHKNTTHVVESAWGSSPEIAAMVNAVKACKKPRAFFVQANETSTGVRHPVQEIAKAVRAAAPDCLIVVDCISSLCAHPISIEKDGIDCIVAGSQKGFGMSPGLAFIALSKRATFENSRPKFYFDLAKERKGQAKGRSAWTPAISLIQELDAALDSIEAVGIEAMIAHHQKMADATRAAVSALGLKLFAPNHASNAVTAISVPENVDGQALVKHLKQKYGAILSGGQDQLKGKIIRFAHLGFASRFHVIEGIAALEFALNDMGYTFELGSGVAAAVKHMARS